jgi:hypothetical protein
VTVHSSGRSPNPSSRAASATRPTAPTGRPHIRPSVTGPVPVARGRSFTVTGRSEYGALTAHDPRRPVSDETYRRKIARQLNKGENLHALRRDLFYASEGAQPRTANRAGMGCLTIATNAIVTWISEYYGRAIAEMRAGGHLIQDEVLAHPPRQRQLLRHHHRGHRR